MKTWQPARRVLLWTGLVASLALDGCGEHPSASYPRRSEATPPRSAGSVSTEPLRHSGRRLAVLGAVLPSPALGFNADMTVLCMRGGEVLKKWRGNAMWLWHDGPALERYEGTVQHGRIAWQGRALDPDELRVDIEVDGTGGESLLAWMHRRTRVIVVIVKPRQVGTGSGQGVGTAGKAKPAGPAKPAKQIGPRRSVGASERARLRARQVTQVSVRDLKRSRQGGGRRPSAARGAGTSAGRRGGHERGKVGGSLAEDGGVDGEFSRITGEKFGAAHGAIGGDGAHSDAGARGAMALFGGLYNVPAGLRPAVEIALALQEANVLGIGKKFFKHGVRSFASPVAARTTLASEARRYARTRMGPIQARLARKRAFRELSEEERKRVLRITAWDLQRQYFAGVEKAAVKRQRALHKKLGRARSSARKAALEDELARLDTVVEAARVKPIAGRLPRNHEYAGKAIGPEKLPPKYRQEGLRFTEQGFPDFEPHAVTLPNGKKHVKIELTGNRRRDNKLANQAAGWDARPIGYTWHHHEEMGVMILVPEDLHEIAHTGGAAVYKHLTGVMKYD